MNDTTARLLAAQASAQNNQKSPTVALLLWLFLGVFGAHRFYLGDTGVGLGQLLTLGGLGVWALLDVFFLFGRVRQVNEEALRSAYYQHGVSL